jgi:thiol:disulfide interchange protein
VLGAVVGCDTLHRCPDHVARPIGRILVRTALQGFTLLKADVTANSVDDQALLKRFGIFGPPTTAFFPAGAGECRNFRLVGFVPPERFREHLERLGQECIA